MLPKLVRRVEAAQMANSQFSLLVYSSQGGGYLVQLLDDVGAPLRTFCAHQRLTMTMLVSELAEAADPLLSLLEYERRL